MKNANTAKQTITEHTAAADGLDKLRELLTAQRVNTEAIEALQNDLIATRARMAGALDVDTAAALAGEAASIQAKLEAASVAAANIESALRQERAAAQTEGIRCARAAAVSRHGGRYRAAQGKILDAVNALRDAVADAEQTMTDAEGEAAPLHAAGVRLFDSLNGLGVRPGSYSSRLSQIESALAVLVELAGVRPRNW